MFHHTALQRCGPSNSTCKLSMLASALRKRLPSLSTLGSFLTCATAHTTYMFLACLLHFPRGVEVLLLVAVGVSYRRLLLLQFSQELEALLTAAAVPASVKR